MAIIKQYHKDTNTTYVYASTSYWDPEKKQSRSKRQCIGKIDPVTGDIVPTGKRGQKKKEPDSSATDKELAELTGIIESVRKENLDQGLKIMEQEKEIQELKKLVHKLKSVLFKVQALVNEKQL